MISYEKLKIESTKLSEETKFWIKQQLWWGAKKHEEESIAESKYKMVKAYRETGGGCYTYRDREGGKDPGKEENMADAKEGGDWGEEKDGRNLQAEDEDMFSEEDAEIFSAIENVLEHHQKRLAFKEKVGAHWDVNDKKESKRIIRKLEESLEPFMAAFTDSEEKVPPGVLLAAGILDQAGWNLWPADIDYGSEMDEEEGDNEGKDEPRSEGQSAPGPGEESHGVTDGLTEEMSREEYKPRESMPYPLACGYLDNAIDDEMCTSLKEARFVFWNTLDSLGRLYEISRYAAKFGLAFAGGRPKSIDEICLIDDLIPIYAMATEEPLYRKKQGQRRDHYLENGGPFELFVMRIMSANTNSKAAQDYNKSEKRPLRDYIQKAWQQRGAPRWP